MTVDIILLVLSLGIILVSAELFTNGVEWLGHRLQLAEGAVGSVLAAVGTALPETLVPIVAILISRGEHADEIGIGGILGAPFMLSTLAFAVTGIAAIGFRKRRAQGSQVTVNRTVMRRDLGYFLFMYALAVLTGIWPVAARFPGFHVIAPLILVAGYVFYLYLNLREAGEIGDDITPLRLQVWLTHVVLRRHSAEGDEEFHARREQHKRRRPRLRIITGQVLLALVGILVGAHVFVGGVQAVSLALGVSPLIIALILVPIATELPEKFNSVIWIRQGKDTLAMGNITGAMVFQSSFPVGIGLAFTDWHLVAPAGQPQAALYSAAIALFSGLMVLLLSQRRWKGHRRSQISPFALMGGLALYLLFVALVFWL